MSIPQMLIYLGYVTKTQYKYKKIYINSFFVEAISFKYFKFMLFVISNRNILNLFYKAKIL